MKLNKTQFCTYINKYREMLEQEDEILEVLKVDSEWAPSDWISNYYEVLSDMCELPKSKNTGTLLDWFVFDTNFGEVRNVVLNKGRRWIIDSPQILYDFIKESEK